MTNREIDALIATKLMGWVLCEAENGNERPEAWTYSKAQNNDGWYWEGQPESQEAWKWAPTTDPAASKQVREKLAELGFDWSLDWDSDEPHYTFAVDRHEPDGHHLQCHDDEFMAVALCALKAVE